MQISTVTLSRLGVNFWKIIWEIYRKIDKMSISDWRTVEKVRQKLEKPLILSILCWNLEEKINEIFGEMSRKLWKSMRKFVRNLSKLWKNLCKFY